MSTNGKKWMKRLNVFIMKRYIFYGISKVKGVDLGVGGGGGCWGASPYSTLLKTLRWLDWIFWGWYLPTLNINYVSMSKDMENNASE